MDKVVITIARQYGSGGRTVGEMLANKLGIPYYDKDIIIKMASEESGINEALFATVGEKIKNPMLFRLSKTVHNDEVVSPESDDFTSAENLFNYQAKIIRQVAKEQSCVIVGRCADYILKDYDNVLSVFVHAPSEFCIEKATMKLSMSRKEIEKFIQKTDKNRADYYKYHTGREWTDARNYDLCLNSSALGFDKCVEGIIAYMKVRFR